MQGSIVIQAIWKSCQKASRPSRPEEGHTSSLPLDFLTGIMKVHDSLPGRQLVQSLGTTAHYSAANVQRGSEGCCACVLAAWAECQEITCTAGSAPGHYYARPRLDR